MSDDGVGRVGCFQLRDFGRFELEGRGGHEYTGYPNASLAA
jgi:hypothetical protein